MPAVKRANPSKRAVLYVRVPLAVHGKVKQIAQHRGYPHTMNSVAAELIELGIDTIEVGPGPRTAVDEGLATAIVDTRSKETP